MAFNEQMQVSMLPVLTQVEATTGDVFTWIPKKSMLIRDIGVVLTELVALNTTDCLVSFDHTNTAGGVVRAEKAEFTITEADALGTEFLASVDATAAFVPFVVEAGDTVFVEQKQQGVDGDSATGAYRIVLYYEWIPDGKS